jgi:predicted Zn-dependent protease
VNRAIEERRRLGSGVGFAVALLVGAAASLPAQVLDDSASRERRAIQAAQQLERAGRPNEAVAVLETLLTDQPASVAGLVLMSQLVQDRGEPERVLPWVERAAQWDGEGLPVVRQVWVRGLVAAGWTDSARSVARAWTEATPNEPMAWAELSALEVAAGSTDDAIEVLERGRRAIASDRFFVQELARLYATAERYGEAASEWVVMLAWGDPGVEAVSRTLTTSGVDRDTAVAALRYELARSTTTYFERRGGLHLALTIGDVEWARRMAAETVREVSGGRASQLLADYVGRARNAGDPAGAAWAARILSAEAGTPADSERWLAAAADLAFEAGDTTEAWRAFTGLVGEAEPGSDAHRLSLNRLHAMTAPTDPLGAQELLRRYRVAYPDDERTAATMAVATADAWVRAGALGRARRTLETGSIGDAAAAASRAAALGRLEVLEGRPTAARDHLKLAAGGAGPGDGERLAAIELLHLLNRADSTSVAELGRGALAVRSKQDPAPLAEAVGRWQADGAVVGASLTRLAARELAAAGFVAEAGMAMETLVRTWPKSAEAPGALLDLARAAGDDPGAASRWLEALIVEHPDSALAPEARRMLAKLARGEGGA